MTDYLDEVWNRGRLDRASDYIDDRYEIEGVGRGPEASAANAWAFRDAFPDLTVEVVDTVARGARVAVWFRLSGTHEGTFRGHPASGRQATWEEVGFLAVESDKIVAGRFLADMFGLRKAIGVIPPDVR